MSPIKVIGASFGDCDTNDLKNDLTILGYKTHHMQSFLKDPSLSCDEFYSALKNRKEIDWDSLYKNYDAVIDWTGSMFYEDLLLKYPDAKVLLTVRSADSWYLSIKNTKIASNLDSNHSCQKVSTALCGWVHNPEEWVQEKKMKQIYLDHITQVKKAVPTDRLLVLNQGEGWDKICMFLGRDVPGTSYPNTATEIENHHYIPSKRPHLIPTIRITTV